VEHFDLVLANGDVVLPGGQRRLNVGVRSQRIASLSSDPLQGAEILDVSGLAVLPGLIDEHFHVWWGYDFETHLTGSRAAVRGGVTTVIEMPLDSPVTLTAEALETKLATAGSEYITDYAMYGGYLRESPDEMAAMHGAGVAAFKLFTGAVAPPGMYPGVTPGETYDAMQRAQSLHCPVVVHAESESIVEIESSRLQRAGRMDPGAWDEARPWFSELEAVQSVGLMSALTGCSTVIAHVPSPQVITAISGLRREGTPIWAESCTHQLCLAKEDMERDTRLKWNPPTRSRAAVDSMWSLLRAGDVHCIGSDHAPLPKIPDADIWTQNPGIGNGVETMFPVLATEALYTRDVPLTRLVDLFCTNPARIFGLYPRKGAITVGADADFTVVELNGQRTLDSSSLEWHDPDGSWSPYDGRELRVYPVYTILRGSVVYGEGEVTAQPGSGHYIRAERDALC
jgi:dihydroorotase-like cyclic amidohydrolase